MNAKVKSNILGGLLSVVLLVVIFFEFKIGFDMLYSHQISRVSDFIGVAYNQAHASVSIDEVSVYEEIPAVAEDGDVLEINGYDARVKINGTLTDESMSTYGKYTYSSAADSQPLTLAVENKKTSGTEFVEALQSFWHGDPEALLNACSIAHDMGDVIYYQDSFVDGNVPVIYVGVSGLYYMFVESSDGYLLISSQEPFELTNDKVTVHFGDPSANPMLSHTYSDYETLAAENTIRNLLEGGDSETVVDNPYTSGSPTGSSDTYTSESDDNIRKQMAALANYEFDKDGTSDETTYKVDITSDEAKKSMWELTSTSYSYERAGLKLSMLSGKRSASEFTISGNINNTLDAERPYVIVIKYLDSNSGLLGLSVIDNREKPLEASGVSTFTATVTPTRNNIDIQKITSVMFEVY